MDITINGFDMASIRSAINQLKRIRNKDLSTNACLDVANYGAAVAQREFAGAIYDGTNDVQVAAKPTEFGAEVRASGNATLFIEYGSGAVYPAYEGIDPYGRGSWSEGPLGKGHWKNPNGWYYAHGKRSMGNPPANAMFHAEKEMLDYISRGLVNGEQE